MRTFRETAGDTGLRVGLRVTVTGYGDSCNNPQTPPQAAPSDGDTQSFDRLRMTGPEVPGGEQSPQRATLQAQRNGSSTKLAAVGPVARLTVTVLPAGTSAEISP